MSKSKKRISPEIKIEKSSGNVFEDIGLENPSSELLRSEIALEIFKELKKKKLTQTEAAKLLGVKQPDVSKLKNGDFSHFSLERLLGLLNKLGKSIEIKVRGMKKSKRATPGIFVFGSPTPPGVVSMRRFP